MPKTAKPIMFERIGPNLYRTESRSNPGEWYNVGVVADGQARCCCYAANRRLGNCAHASALVEQGLAVLEIVAHNATARVGGPSESNFVVECACGHVSQVGTLDPAYAAQSAAQHNYTYSDEAKNDRLRRLFG